MGGGAEIPPIRQLFNPAPPTDQVMEPVKENAQSEGKSVSEKPTVPDCRQIRFSEGNKRFLEQLADSGKKSVSEGSARSEDKMVLEKLKVSEEEPISEQTTVSEKEPISEQTTVSEEKPVLEKSTHFENKSVSQKPTAFKDEPLCEQITFSNDNASSEQTITSEGKPVLKQPAQSQNKLKPSVPEEKPISVQLTEKYFTKRSGDSKGASSVAEKPTPANVLRFRGGPKSGTIMEGQEVSQMLQTNNSAITSGKDNAMKQAIARNKEILAKKAKNLSNLRKEIQEYKPGQKLLLAGGMSISDYSIPQETVLLLVGDMGAGKSTLVNNIHRAVNNTRIDLDIAATARSTTGSHSLLLQEYAITPRILIFDTRGLSVGNTGENVQLLKEWVKDGVRDSQPVLRSSDGQESKEAIQERGRLYQGAFCKRRVNFAIYVLNAATVHRVLVNAARSYEQQSAEAQRVRKIYGALHQFKDYNPIVVMTHGDQLSNEQREAARVFIADTLGIDAGESVFDIAGFTGREQEENEVDPLVDAAILTMLQQALKLADRSLPPTKGVSAAVKTAAYAHSTAAAYAQSNVAINARRSAAVNDPPKDDCSECPFVAVFILVILFLLALFWALFSGVRYLIQLVD